MSYLINNIVYLELRRRGYEIYVGKFDNKEVDFIAVDGEKTTYIQVTYLLAEEIAEEITIEREFSALEAIEDNFPKIVISMDRTSGGIGG